MSVSHVRTYVHEDEVGVMNQPATPLSLAPLSCRRPSSKQEGLSSPSGSQVAFNPCYIGVCLPKKKETLLQVHIEGLHAAINYLVL